MSKEEFRDRQSKKILRMLQEGYPLSSIRWAIGSESDAEWEALMERAGIVFCAAK